MHIKWSFLENCYGNGFEGALTQVNRRSHLIFKVSVSLEHSCLQLHTKVLDSPCHRFLRKVIPDQWRRLHGARGHVPPTFTNGWAPGAPWIEEQLTRNWPNCTDHHESQKVEEYDQKIIGAPHFRSGPVPPLSNSFRRHCSRSSPVLCDATRFLVAYCRLHFVYETQNCNADYYVTDLIPKLVEDATSLMPDNLSTGWRSSSPRMRRKTGYAPLQWLFLQSMNDHQTRQLLICLIIMCWVPCWKPITNWTSKPSITEEFQTRLEMIWNDLSQKPVARAVQNFGKRLQACVCKFCVTFVCEWERFPTHICS